MPRPRALARRGGIYVVASTYISSRHTRDVSPNGTRMDPPALARDPALTALERLCYPWPRADLAQWVEHQLPKLGVTGSSPVVRFSSTKPKPAL
jgi:hypothetical protein